MSNHARRHKALDLDPPTIEPPGFWARVVRAFGLASPPAPVCVARLASRVEAEMMSGYLRSHGVNAHVSADDAGGTDPIYQTAFGVRVLVASGQAGEARRLLAKADL